MPELTSAQVALYIEEFRTLRVETLQSIARLYRDLWLIFTFMTLGLFTYHVGSIVWPAGRWAFALYFVILLGVATPYVATRDDHLIHRPAPAVASIENTVGIQGWENHHKPGLWWRWQLVPLDVILGLGLLTTLLWWTASQARSQHFVTIGQYWLLWLIWLVGALWLVGVNTIMKDPMP
ncbi:MAG: hypothetical protein HY545_00845 [Candidatus Doudnabacteria bacterium]|nr:hypothetical protein [Candidatus Doudnabacteria bacterium]